MPLQIVASGGDNSELEAQIAQAQADAEQAKADAAKAQAAGDNAQQMVRNRDPRLVTVESNYADLLALAQSVQGLNQASVSDRVGLHAVDADLQAQINALKHGIPGADGKSAYQVARDAGYGGTQTQWLASLKGTDGAAGAPGQSVKGDKGDPGTPADMSRVAAVEAAIAALQALKVTVGYGVANLPASLAAGATTNVTVTLSRNMGSATYSVGYCLSGGVSLLGQLSAVGVTAQTATTVTVQVKNTGLTALLNLSTAALSVVAARDA